MTYTAEQLLPIDIRVDIAPGAAPDGDPAAWQWLDISSYRRQASDVEIDYGRADEASDVEPGSSSVELDLRDGLLSPRNPNSELYGLIGVNTPIRYRLPLAVDTFTRTVASGWGTADTGQAWSVVSPGTGASVASGAGKIALATANTLTTMALNDVGALDVDMYYSVSLSAVTTGGPWISAAQVRKHDADNNYRIHTELKPSGVITCKIVERLNAVETTLNEVLSVPVTYSANSKVWNHVQVDGAEIRLKVWAGLITDEPAGWTITASNAEVEGAGIAITQWRFSTVTNVGTLTASVDDLRIDAVLWSGNVPEWPPRWDKSGNDSTVTLAAAGALRRLDIGDDVSVSALSNQLPRYLPVGYWPFEDGAESTSAASGIPSGFSASVTNVTFNADTEALPGATAMAKLNGVNSRVLGRVSADPGPAFTGIIFFQMPALPAGDTLLVQWDSEGTIVRYRVLFNATGFRLEGDSVSGATTTTPLSSGTITYTINPLAVLSVRLQITQSGGNIAWALAWNQVGQDVFWGFSGTVAGTAGRPQGFRMVGSTATIGMLFGQVWLGPATIPYVDPTFLLVSNGYDGEIAAARIRRACAERLGADNTGVPIAISLGEAADEPLGKQAPGKFLTILHDAADSTLGTLYERGSGLGYLPRSALYNAPVIMTIPWSAGDLSEAPAPTDDDQRLRTRWTVSRSGGSSATYQNDEAAARYGVIGDSLEVNIQNDAPLLNYASWKTALSTVDEMRWPTIVIDLVARPELIPFFLGCRIGSRIMITAPKPQVAGITIDLIIEGIKQELGRRKWLVTLSCSPASPYSVGTYLADGATVTADTKRKDSRTSTLNVGYNATATTMVVKFTTLSDQWSQINEPYLWTVAGETIRVDSMGAVTGSSSPWTQTATVTRSMNGVSKPQAAGAPVHIHPSQLARYAL